MYQKVIETCSEVCTEACANFACTVFILAGVIFFCELVWALVSTWKKILTK